MKWVKNNSWKYRENTMFTAFVIEGLMKFTQNIVGL